MLLYVYTDRKFKMKGLWHFVNNRNICTMCGYIYTYTYHPYTHIDSIKFIVKVQDGNISVLRF